MCVSGSVCGSVGGSVGGWVNGWDNGWVNGWVSPVNQVAEGGTLQMDIYKLFYRLLVHYNEQACKTDIFEHFELSLKIQNGRRQLMTNLGFFSIFGQTRHIGFTGER